MDDENNEICLAPPSTYTFGIPNEPNLLLEYGLYKASMGTKRLPSECHREVFTEEFIENERRGTLVDLCVRALAKLGTRNIAAPVKQDPLKLRIHYDSLDVNLPLIDCYFVEDLRFWRRVVLAKSSDQSLPFKTIEEYDWRGIGISLKYVELVEACPAAYWPEEQMARLGGLVRKYVKTLHIKHLQSLTENAFAHYVNSEPELDVTSEESIEPEISSDEPDSSEEMAYSESSEREMSSPDLLTLRKDSFVRMSEKLHEIIEIDVNSSITDMRRATELKMKRHEARIARNEARQQLRNFQQEKRNERQRRQQSRALLRKLPEPAPVLKKKTKARISGVFDLAVAPEPDDGEDEIPDKRNKFKLLGRLKRYDYPDKHCHHIDLSFVRYFDKLNSLTIEFLGPEMNRDYHKRHMNFSIDDMVHLAAGISHLYQLKVFRLRNSRMDSMKLLIICRALKQLDALEVVDFGYDQLQDDCNVALEMLLDRKTMLKRLELEYNKLGSATVESIGYALRYNAEDYPHGPALQYLGLAHNPIGDYFINSLLHSIIGTQHIEELNINGVEVDSDVVARDVCQILRSHPPLRSLDMAAIPVSRTDMRELICSLESNHRVTHFDCRACDLDSDYEYEADIIVRRNTYETDFKTNYSSFLMTENTDELLAKKRHHIVKKLDVEQDRLAECIKNRPTPTSSSESSVKEEQVEEPQEQEYDIWKVLGLKSSTHQVTERETSQNSRQSSENSFIYNPNLFDLDQVREHMHLPGPGNRYYFFQKQTGQTAQQ